MAEETAVLRIAPDGVTTERITIFPDSHTSLFTPLSLSWSSALNGIVVKEQLGTGRVVLLRDAWYYSSRRRWLSIVIPTF